MRTEVPYVAIVTMAAALAVIFLVPVGCSPREAASPAPSPAAQFAPTTSAPQPPPPVEPSSPPPVEPSSPADASPTPTTTEPQQAKRSTVPAAPPVSAPASPATTPESELPPATPPPSTPPPSTSTPSTSTPSAAPPSPPAAAASPPAAPRPSVPQPASSTDGVVDPGGEIAIEATRPGLTRIGATKCGICHKPQHASWSESAHAKRQPPLDCESCHGAGSEYKSLTVMKDAEKAKAAGLVLPTATFCATCHREGWTDDGLPEAHAHKESPKP